MFDTSLCLPRFFLAEVFEMKFCLRSFLARGLCIATCGYAISSSLLTAAVPTVEQSIEDLRSDDPHVKADAAHSLRHRANAGDYSITKSLFRC